jgi:hypothetical protein
VNREELLALPVTVPLLTAGAAFALGRDATYDLARRQELPFRVLTLGRRKVVTKAALLDALGIRDDEAGAPTPAVATTGPTPRLREVSRA